MRRLRVQQRHALIKSQFDFLNGLNCQLSDRFSVNYTIVYIQINE